MQALLSDGLAAPQTLSLPTDPSEHWHVALRSTVTALSLGWQEGHAENTPVTQLQVTRGTQVAVFNVP